MGYYRIYAVIIVPAARLAQAKAFMAKNGLDIDVFRALILKIDPDSQPARGYAGMLNVDIGGHAALKNAIDGVANCYLFASMKKRTAAAEALAFIDGKGYRLKPT